MVVQRVYSATFHGGSSVGTLHIQWSPVTRRASIFVIPNTRLAANGWIQEALVRRDKRRSTYVEKDDEMGRRSAWPVRRWGLAMNLDWDQIPIGTS